MGNPNSKLIPKNPRKRKLCDFENYSTEFPPKKRLKAISNHGNSSAELSYIVLDDDSSSELSSLPTTPSRDSTPAEFDKTVAKSSPPKQPNLISEHKTDHAKCGAEPHDNNAETGEPPQPENLHPSPESNTHHSNPLAQHPNSVKVQPQEQKELNPISKDNTVHSNATAQPDVVVDQIKNLLEGVLQDGQKHNSVSEQTACYTNSAALFRELESSLVQAILQFNFGHRSAAAPVNDLLDSLRQGIEHFNSVYKHVTKRRNSAAQIYDILGNLLPQVEELHSLSDDDSVTRVCDLVRFTMEELSQSHPVSTNNVSRRKSTIHANDTGMQDVHTQPPARPKPDPGYNIPVVRSNGFSILEVGRNAASQYQLINGNLWVPNNDADADIGRVLSSAALEWEIKKANVAISAALDVDRKKVKSFLIERHQRFSTTDHIRDYWKTVPAYKPSLLGLPLHVQFDICHKVLTTEDEDPYAEDPDFEDVDVEDVDVEDVDVEDPKAKSSKDKDPKYVCPYYCQGYEPDSRDFDRHELQILRVSPQDRWNKVIMTPNIDISLFLVNRYFSSICSRIYYSCNVFVFNDARSAIWFFRFLDDTKLRQIKNVVFNITSGFFLGSDTRSRYDVCEEELWCRVFMWLKPRQQFENVVIRWYRMKGDQVRLTLSDVEWADVDQARLDLPFYIAQLRGIEKVRIENHRCGFMSKKCRGLLADELIKSDGADLEGREPCKANHVLGFEQSFGRQSRLGGPRPRPLKIDS